MTTILGKKCHSRNKKKNINYDWFTYLCAFFTEELKENTRLKNILDGQVLSKLSGISVNTDDFLNQLVHQKYRENRKSKDPRLLSEPRPPAACLGPQEES